MQKYKYFVSNISLAFSLKLFQFKEAKEKVNSETTTIHWSRFISCKSEIWSVIPVNLVSPAAAIALLLHTFIINLFTFQLSMMTGECRASPFCVSSYSWWETRETKRKRRKRGGWMWSDILWQVVFGTERLQALLHSSWIERNIGKSCLLHVFHTLTSVVQSLC